MALQFLLMLQASERGQKYIDACEAISKILMETEEWKALPDYSYIYD